MCIGAFLPEWSLLYKIVWCPLNHALRFVTWKTKITPHLVDKLFKTQTLSQIRSASPLPAALYINQKTTQHLNLNTTYFKEMRQPDVPVNVSNHSPVLNCHMLRKTISTLLFRPPSVINVLIRIDSITVAIATITNFCENFLCVFVDFIAWLIFISRFSVLCGLIILDVLCHYMVSSA